ncbi:MAG: hypothetical protein U9R41_00815 [Candidatus Marinimicrobia bacterium]|nr:hypothetical protein [Candidatus Neomarinimicrobiota bacterium]
MKNLMKLALVFLIGLMVIGCSSSYVGKVDVIGVGAGEKPTSHDRHFVNESQVKNIKVTHTPNIKFKEQDVSENVKFVAGDALIKEFSGDPQLMVDYLNYSQKFNNLVLILDKNGVVAWEGYVKFLDFTNAFGVSSYGLTGPKRISFHEAMETFIGKEKKAKKYKEDKKIEFPKNNKESFAKGFSYEKKYPFLFTKLPDMGFTTLDGNKIQLSKFSENGKPTVLVFYMSQAKKTANASAELKMAADALKMLTNSGKRNEIPLPNELLKQIEDIYFK